MESVITSCENANCAEPYCRAEALDRLTTIVIESNRLSDRPIGGVLVDGPPGSGKSHIAAELQARIVKSGRHCRVFGADQFLIYRSARLARLESFRARKNCSGQTPLPLNEHVSYWRWREMVDALTRLEDAAGRGDQILLDGLYDRSTGKCDRALTMTVPPQCFFIFEGSYVIGNILTSFPKVLVWADLCVCRQRKWDRATSNAYPTSDRLAQIYATFDLIERPSYLQYWAENANQADVIFDNSSTSVAWLVKPVADFPVPQTSPAVSMR